MGRTKGAKGTKGTKGCFTGALREEAAESEALHWSFAIGKHLWCGSWAEGEGRG